HLDVHAYLRRRTDRETALDVLAETFMVVWRRIDTVPGGDAARPWIFGVARKTLANHRRSQRRSQALHKRLAERGSISPPDPATVVVRHAEAWEVLDAMDRLGDDDREVLRLATWEDLPHDEIAQVFGCSPHAVDQRLLRAKKRLERELQRTRRKQRRSQWARTHSEGGTP
ncbi:MAG: sigma-70 family RNA polymerase sigma factor, partial [Actinomycetota bacterium]